MQTADSLVQDAYAKHQHGDLAGASQLYQQALGLAPDHFNALQLLGVLAIHQRDYVSADVWLGRALQVIPSSVPALLNHALVLQELGRSEQALACYDKALLQHPDHAAALNGRGLVLNHLGDEEQAFKCLEAATRADPAFAEAAFNFGTMLDRRGHREIARAEYQRALDHDPRYVDAMYHLGVLLLNQGQLAEGNIWLERVLELDPSHRQAGNHRALVAWQTCDWQQFDHRHTAILQDVAAGIAAATTFQFLSVSDDPALQMMLARSEYRDLGLDRLRPKPPAAARGEASDRRIRVAYVSGDFREHAVSYLTAGLFELHDRTRFEVIGISFGPNTQDAMYQRVASSFDRFIDVAPVSDKDVAVQMRALGVDIAVDLAGATQNARPGIFAHRAAPVQVNFLGFPGTGYPMHDYIIGDEYVIPAGFEKDYVEAVVRMPDVFQANDHKRRISDAALTRQQFGLPAKGFVFCAFHASSKINPGMFDIWMRLLQTVEASVLWLATGNANTQANLRLEARARGVSGDRLVFTGVMPYDQHLARLRLADLVLDTWPFNGGTTTSDVLYAGLPMVTVSGRSFASRMSGSLLRAMGLVELIAEDLGQYEALAIGLAHDSKRLQSLRARIIAAGSDSALFDTGRFTTHLELAFEQMNQRQKGGLAPASISVARQATQASSPDTAPLAIDQLALSTGPQRVWKWLSRR
jgi:predicted O-linked N-acetylglucosamine transferase (SPINDLY family)